MNDMDTIRNKANARQWSLTTTLDFSTAYTKNDLSVVFHFSYGRLLSARLYRKGTLIDSLFKDTVSKGTSIIPSVMYLLESV